MNEIHEIDTLEDYLARGKNLRGCVIQGLDLGQLKRDWAKAKVRGAIFLGCEFPSESLEVDLSRRGAVLFPRFEHLPYRPYRPQLYTREELGEGYTAKADNSIDKQIYDHFVNAGRNKPDVYEALAQRLHDHAIDDAMQDLLEGRTDGTNAPKKIVAIMGGHGVPRTDRYFRKVAEVTRGLTAKGYFVASGGGPGIMEAANLGAYLANVSRSDFYEALQILSSAPVYTSKGYVEAAMEVISKHPKGCASLAIPTWFYGHEPSNLFSPYIAKYFSNSIREDGLLAIAEHGVIFAPGSAGTNQEIFMDATQNHYGTFRYASPMIFLGRDHYVKETRIYPTLKRLAKGRTYDEFLEISDDPRRIVKMISEYELTTA